MERDEKKKRSAKLFESVYAIDVWKYIQWNEMTPDTEEHKTSETKNFSTKTYVHAFQTNRNKCIALRIPDSGIQYPVYIFNIIVVLCMIMPPPLMFDKEKKQ